MVSSVTFSFPSCQTSYEINKKKCQTGATLVAASQQTQMRQVMELTSCLMGGGPVPHVLCHGW